MGVNSTVTILDTQGREVFQRIGTASEMTLNLNLDRGYYLVLVQSESGDVQNVRLILK